MSELIAVSDFFIRIYPHIEPWVDPVRGWLMPEYFWDAFYAKDRDQMELEARRAREKLTILEERYGWFTDQEKLAIEDAYLAILGIAARESGRSGESV